MCHDLCDTTKQTHAALYIACPLSKLGLVKGLCFPKDPICCVLDQSEEKNECSISKEIFFYKYMCKMLNMNTSLLKKIPPVLLPLK